MQFSTLLDYRFEGVECILSNWSCLQESFVIMNYGFGSFQKVDIALAMVLRPFCGIKGK